MKETFYLLAVAFACTNALPIEDKYKSNRIGNGVNAANNQFPYAVSIQRNDAISQALATRGHICGGVLITLQHVLTAARCTYTAGANGTMISIEPSEHRVFAGTDLSDTSVDRARTIANYTRHPQYIGAPAQVNDVAVMTLLCPFDEGVVIPLALPSSDFQPPDFTRCTMAGWGVPEISTNLPSTQLLYTNKYIYSQALCTTLYNIDSGIANIFPTMMCAASYDIISSGCAGDEGNALVCEGTLTGILIVTNNCQATGYPELYTRVSNYTEWIRDVTGSASAFKPVTFLLILFSVFHVVFQKIIAEQ